MWEGVHSRITESLRFAVGVVGRSDSTFDYTFYKETTKK